MAHSPPPSRHAASTRSGVRVAILERGGSIESQDVLLAAVLDVMCS
jgi:hypothetical protein